MRAIMVYVEGGGNTVAEKAELRRGFDALFGTLKHSASAKGIRLSFICCGGRSNAYKTFYNEHVRAPNQTICALLVDSEDGIADELKPVSPGENDDDETRRIRLNNLNENAKARKDHLARREPWDLRGVPPEHIHLMVYCMETWIVADPEALELYYGKRFHRDKLPISPNLESVPKLDVYSKLAKATKETSKGEYAKISHASKLLACISPNKVVARCPRFATFTNWLNDQIQS